MTPELPAGAAVTAAYWLCSAVAQALAALTALTGLFAVYRLQSMRQEKDDIRSHALFAMRRARDVINSHAGTPGPWPSRIDHEPVPAGGEHGWVEICLDYNREYAPKLAAMKGIGGGIARWAEDMEQFFQATFRRHEAWTNEENACKRWATTLTIADGLVTLGSLAVIPYITRLGRALAPTMSVVLVLAGVALLLTVYACVSILHGGYLWPLRPRRPREEPRP